VHHIPPREVETRRLASAAKTPEVQRSYALARPNQPVHKCQGAHDVLSEDLMISGHELARSGRSSSRCVDLEENDALFRVLGDCVPVHVAAADFTREELQITELNERLFDIAAFMQPAELCEDLDGFG